MLALKSTRLSQAGATHIEWSNPFADNLIHALTATTGSIEPVSGVPAVIGGYQSIGPGGIVRGNNSAQKAWTMPDLEAQRIASGVTIFIRARRTATCANFYSVVGKNWKGNAPSSFVSYELAINPSNLGQNNFRASKGIAGGIATADGSVSDSLQWINLCASFGEGGIFLYADSVLLGSNGNSQPIDFATTGDNSFGTNFTNKSGGYEYEMVYLFNKQLSANEIIKLSANPWQIFR